MNICFIVDLWEKLTPQTNSTLRLIREAAARGHNVGLLHPRNLTVRENVTRGLFQMVEKMEKVPEKMEVFCKKIQFKKQRLPVKGFDVIFLRADPPLDSIMLNFLDSVKDDTFILNDVDGLRKANTKLYLTSFEDSSEFIPETHVSKDKEYLMSVVKEAKSSKMILKPLDGYGGHGVILIETKAMKNINSLLDFYIGDEGQKNYVILQEFVEGAEKGDVRVLMLNGEIIGAMRRVPADDDVRANVHAGGIPVKHVLTKKEKEICNLIGPRLVSDGIYFAGVDLIGEKLIEVNVISPGGIVNINRMNKVRLEKKILDFVELKHRKIELAYQRKQDFRKAVEDA